ncbi:uncharacterized protein Fot_09137 [Forsythia ovata]|uniref:Uncharacterized protein n=1 Tax=Forsythia ovata TaxID=205694 RepID=A0ABD1WDG2_9LAMI
MAGSATGRGCNATFISLSVPPPPASHKFPIIPKQLVYTNKCSSFCVSIGRTQISSPTPIHTPRSSSSSSSSSSTPVVVEEEETGSSPTGDNFPVQSESARDSDSLPSIRGCKACGREEIQSGCNGEGRIQGGIATVPGFGWWPIKAYRPCPAFVASGGRYRRTGQSMDEVASGREWEKPVQENQ